MKDKDYASELVLGGGFCGAALSGIFALATGNIAMLDPFGVIASGVGAIGGAVISTVLDRRAERKYLCQNNPQVPNFYHELNGLDL
mgnify:CR=1 FL=1